MEDSITFIFDGGMAEAGRLDLYDASTSMLAAARVYSILGHYYQTGKIITQAPRSKAKVYIVPAEHGSFKQQIIVGVVTTAITVPFTLFATRLLDKWMPAPNQEMQNVVHLLEQQNELLRQQQGLPPQPTPRETAQHQQADRFIDDHLTECHVLRSILAKSTKDIFRPVGRSADYLAIAHGITQSPVAALDISGVRLLEADVLDNDETHLIGVVNAFSRSSKSGALFCRELGRGMLFTYEQPGRLPSGDDFSWSQYTRQPLEMRGRYVRFFDGSVKRFFVYEVRRLENIPPEVNGLEDVLDMNE